MSDIVKYGQGVNDLLENLSQKKDLANILIKSGLIPSGLNTPEKVLVCLFKAQELNLPALEGLSGMAVINGKVTLQGNLILAMINRSGKCSKMKITEEKDKCTVTMARKDYEFEYTFTFSLKDAQEAGLTSKDIWRKYQATMLKWRAVSGCARVVFSEIIGGLYTPEEMVSIDDNIKADVDGEGNVIVSEVKNPPKENAGIKKENIEEANFTETKTPTMLELVREKIKLFKTSKEVVDYWTSIKDECKKQPESEQKIIYNEINSLQQHLKKQEQPKEEKPNINVLGETVKNIKFNTSEKELKAIDDMIEKYNGKDKGVIIDQYKAKLLQVGSTHEYQGLPF